MEKNTIIIYIEVKNRKMSIVIIIIIIISEAPIK